MPSKPPPKRRRQARQARQASIQFHAAGHGGARPGAGRPRTRRSRVPHRTRGGVPGHCPVLITLRVRDDVPRLRCGRFVRAFRETLRKGRGARPSRSPAAGVPGGALLDPGRPRALPGGGARQEVPGERHEEPWSAFRTLREPGLRAPGTGAGGPLPPCGEAHADGGAAGAGVGAAGRAQALPAAAAPGAAGGARWCEFGAVVRRLEGPGAASGTLRGPRSRMRSGVAGELAAGQGMAAHRPGRSGGGARRAAARPLGRVKRGICPYRPMSAW